MPDFIAIDFETANQNPNSACAVALVAVEHQEIVNQVSYLIRPPELDFEFTYIHGITPDIVADQPTFAELWQSQLREFVAGEILVAHNAPFDIKVLYYTLKHYGQEPPSNRYFCTVELSRRLWRLRNHKLNTVAGHLGIPLDHHEALSDARACAQIALAGMRKTRSSSVMALLNNTGLRFGDASKAYLLY